MLEAITAGGHPRLCPEQAVHHDKEEKGCFSNEKDKISI